MDAEHRRADGHEPFCDGREVRSRLLMAAACAAVAVAGPLTPMACAAPDMETGIADDAQVLYSGPAVAARTVSEWRRAGIQVVRLHARWAFIAPGVHATHRPKHFHPADPDDPHYNWARLDTAVSLLTAAGIRPMISITGSGPLWSSSAPSRHDPVYRPDPTAFGQFAHAVAARYRGVVHRYLIWNEPNQPGWLKPQFSCVRGACTPVSPGLYRALYRASAAAVHAVDSTAQVLIGTLAPRGHAPTKTNVPMRPLQFLRALGCVNAGYQRITTGGCAHAKPLLAYGFAYHPHPDRMSPTDHAASPDDASIGDLGRLERALDRTVAHGILKPAHGHRFGLYLSEFGYQTNPPDGNDGVSPTQQAAWIQQAEYIAYRDPRVHNLTAYLWRDEPLRPANNGTSKTGGWQSGVYFASGRAKPLRWAFDHPFFIDVRRGRRSVFWGQVRPDSRWTVRIQRNGRHGWSTVARVRTNAAGYWTYRKRITSAARFRFQYTVEPAVAGERPLLVNSTRQTVSDRSLRRR